jgi:glycogen(starch) synthase
LLRLSYDVVIEDYTAFSPCFSFLYTKKPVIGSFQNLHSQKAAKGKGAIKAFSAELFDAIALRHFRNFTAVSPNLTAILQKRAHFTNNISFIGVGINESLYKIDQSTAPDQPAILYIGRIELYQKGIDVLLKAYARLAPRPKLILAGSGVDVKKVQQMVVELGIEREVQLVGRFTDDDKLTLLKNAVFAVMPSRFEGYPVVPLEAMAAGVAFIGTDIPGTADVVGESAVLVAKDNVEELASAMQRLLTDTHFRKELEQKGREHSRRFDWPSISRQFYDFIIRSMTL